MIYSPETREARFRLRFDELRERNRELARENARLRNMVARKNLKIAAMGRDIRELEGRLRHLLRSKSHDPAARSLVSQAAGSQREEILP